MQAHKWVNLAAAEGDSRRAQIARRVRQADDRRADRRRAASGARMGRAAPRREIGGEWQHARRVIELFADRGREAFAAAAKPICRDETRTALDRGDYAAALRLHQAAGRTGRPVGAGQSGASVPARARRAARPFGGGPLVSARGRTGRRSGAERSRLSVRRGTGRDEQTTPRPPAWYRRAAEQGAAEHQFDLGVMYDNGLGVEKDPRESRRMVRQGRRSGLRRS